MTLLGHVKAEMTMKYVLVAGDDLQREFRLIVSEPESYIEMHRGKFLALLGTF
jgi:hypothetical protein